MHWISQTNPPKDSGWYRRFAWLPVTNGAQTVWLEWYWVYINGQHLVFDTRKTPPNRIPSRFFQRISTDGHWRRGKRYLLHPGEVVSKTDGQRHFISSDQLIELYDLDRKKCVVYKPYLSDKFPNDEYADLVDIVPRYDGEYVIASSIAKTEARITRWRKNNPA